MNKTLTPVSIDRNVAFVGIFSVEEEKQENCKYFFISGIGIKIGLSTIGAGYFRNGYMTVSTGLTHTCETTHGKVSIFK